MTAKKAALKAKAPKGATPKSPSKAKRATVRAVAKLPKKKTSALDAAARVLAQTGQAMKCQELIAMMAKKGYWTSPGGSTPHATLYAAMAKEIKIKGANARFRKTGRGTFASTGKG
jgi:hypothetical protein